MKKTKKKNNNNNNNNNNKKKKKKKKKKKINLGDDAFQNKRFIKKEKKTTKTYAACFNYLY